MHVDRFQRSTWRRWTIKRCVSPALGELVSILDCGRRTSTSIYHVCANMAATYVDLNVLASS